MIGVGDLLKAAWSNAAELGKAIKKDPLGTICEILQEVDGDAPREAPKMTPSLSGLQHH